MHRTDAEGNVEGQFHPGNPAIGQRATRIGADWLNAVQEEISAVIENAGIALDKAENDQLYNAIVSLVAGVVGDGSGAVPTTRTISVSGGLLTGGGDLAANRTIGLTKATAPQVAAQALDNVVVTPLALAGLVGRSTVGSGWVIQLGTTKIQIFSGTAIGGDTTTVLSLPEAFTSINKAAWVNGGANSGNENNWAFVNGRGLTTVSVWNAFASSFTVDVIAIGD